MLILVCRPCPILIIFSFWSTSELTLKCKNGHSACKVFIPFHTQELNRLGVNGIYPLQLQIFNQDIL